MAIYNCIIIVLYLGVSIRVHEYLCLCRVNVRIVSTFVNLNST